MKPELYVNWFVISVPGFAQPPECLFPRYQPRPKEPRNANKAENMSPYPGINIGSASELLDFRFKETEILSEKADRISN
jgi:hypothetical protein